jgi:hypothetical protein
MKRKADTVEAQPSPREQYEAVRAAYGELEAEVKAGAVERIPELALRRAELDALKLRRAAP